MLLRETNGIVEVRMRIWRFAGYHKASGLSFGVKVRLGGRIAGSELPLQRLFLKHCSELRITCTDNRGRCCSGYDESARAFGKTNENSERPRGRVQTHIISVQTLCTLLSITPRYANSNIGFGAHDMAEISNSEPESFSSISSSPLARSL